VCVLVCLSVCVCVSRIIEENNGKAPLTYVRFQTVLKNLEPPKRPIPAPTLQDMKGKRNCTRKLNDH